MVRLRVLSFLLGLISFMFASQASAQTAVMKQFSQFGGGGQGLYWVPSSGPISPIAFLAIHRTGDYLAHAIDPGIAQAWIQRSRHELEI